MHISKGLFSAHTGKKCILFSQEVGKIIIVGLGSLFHKYCCYKIFLSCFSFQSESQTFFPFFLVSKDVRLTFLDSRGQTMKSLFLRHLVGPGCLNVWPFDSKQRALNGNLKKQNLQLSEREHCISFLFPHILSRGDSIFQGGVSSAFGHAAPAWEELLSCNMSFHLGKISKQKAL